MATINFDPLKPKEVMDYIKSKDLKLTFDYDEMMHSAHHRSFTVAKVTKLDLLSDMQKAVQKAKEDGTPVSKFVKDLKPTLQKHGWWGEATVINPTTGESKDIYVGSRRLKNILKTNRQVAYAQGRYRQEKGFIYSVYLKYEALNHGNRRKEHQALDGIVLHRDDIWWETNYPKNGWGCDCFTTAYSKKALDKEGLKVHTGKLDDIAEKDWAYHVGKNDNIKDVYAKKVDKLKGTPLYKSSLNEFQKDVKYVQNNKKLQKEIQTLYTTKTPKTIEVAQSDIFGKLKKVFLSSDTVQSHAKREEINSYDYSLIPMLLQGTARVFQQKENIVVLLKKLGKNYRLALKNVEGKDEIFATSLLYVKDLENEVRKLSKFKEIKKGD